MSERLVPGLVSITFRKLAPEEIISLARRAGLRAIEWGADIHVKPGEIERAGQIARLTREAGLAVSSYGSYYKAAHNPDSFPDVLRSAVALGAPRIRVWAGGAGAEKADAAQRDAVEKDLRRIVGMAAKEGIRIALEFHSGTLTSTAESAVRLLDAVEDLETYWQPRCGATIGEALADLQLLALRLSHAHVFQWDQNGVRFPLADGREAWMRYLAALNALNRPVNVQLEYVKDDLQDQLMADAAALITWTSCPSTV